MEDSPRLASPSAWRSAMASARSNPYAIIAGSLFLVLTIWALASPIILYDDWAYHFPFAARLWDIGGGSQTFVFDSHLQGRWDGFPLLWEWLQGLFWSATGNLRATIIPQIILCCLYFVCVSRTLEFPWYWLVLGFFASPMLFIHYQAVYLDLPAGICLALGFILLIHELHAERPSVGRLTGAVIFLGMAGNIKVQGLISAIFIAFTILALAVLRLGLTRKTARIAMILAIAVLCSSATALANFQRHHNPLYPLRVIMAGKSVFPGPEDPESDAYPPNYQGRAGIYVPPAPLSFFLSVTELDWTLRGVSPWYSAESSTGDRAMVAGRSRTGGWGWLFVCLNGFVLIFQLGRMRKEANPMQRSLVLGTLMLFVLTACIPRSHELRYWLFIPLICLPVNARYLASVAQPNLLGGGLAAMMFYGIAQTILTPSSQLRKERWPAGWNRPLPPQFATELRAHGRYCSADSQLFRESTAVTGVWRLLSLRQDFCAPKTVQRAQHGLG